MSSRPVMVVRDGVARVLKECGYEGEGHLRDVFLRNLGLFGELLGEFRLCGTEVGLGLEGVGLAADVVLVDEDGVVTVVEVKLFKNPEIRRSVIGQLLEYLTAAYLGKEEFIRRIRGMCVDGGEIDWDVVRENLRARRIRGIILSDELPPIVAHTIELLNSQLRDIDIYGLELRRYCDEEVGEVLVPQVIGMTAESISEGKSTGGRWLTYDAIREYIKTLKDETLKERLTKILDFVESNQLAVFKRGSTKSPLIRIRSAVLKNAEPLFTISCGDGYVSVNVGSAYREAFTPESARAELVEELKHAGLLPSDFNPDSVQYTKSLLIKVKDMSDEEFEKFMNIIKKYCMRESK